MLSPSSLPFQHHLLSIVTECKCSPSKETSTITVQSVPLVSFINGLLKGPFVKTLKLLIRSFVCNMKRPSVKQSIKQQVSSNLADELSLADGPLHLLARIVLGRQTFFGQWTPHLLVRLVLGRQIFFGQWTPQIQHRWLQCQYTTLGR